MSSKSETSNDVKPKINIISDIKLPPVFTSPTTPSEKKINIISDIKIEPKLEEGLVMPPLTPFKTEIKSEVKNEIKSEVKTEEEIKLPPIQENPFAKMNPLALQGSKEDSGIPYDWVSVYKLELNTM